MTGNDILQRALGLLGYAENNGNIQLTQRILQKSLPLVRLVYSDISRMCGLEKETIESLSDEFEISNKAADVFACGLASYIAATEGDDNAQAFWSAEYNSRRTTLSKITEVKDELPIPEY